MDSVDRNILLQWLQIGLSMLDVVLGSLLTNRMQQVTFNGQLSSKQLLLFGVLQGSVLGLLLLHLLYNAELEQLILCYGLQIRQYADDSQVYMSVSVSEVQTAVHSFAVCIHDVNKWMRTSRLQLNLTKTQVMWLGSSQQLKHVDINNILLLSTTIQVVESTRDLGVMLDSCWHYRRMSQCSVGLVTTSSDNFAHSSNWGRWRLQEPQLRHYFLSVVLLQFTALQAAGQTTAQDAVCAEYYCMTDHWHTTQWPHLTSITWAPLAAHPRARQVQSSMPGSPVAVRAGASLLGRRLPSRVEGSTRHSLQSADISTCVVPWTLSSYGDRTFAAAGPHLWNSLPVKLCNPDITYGLFRWQLKGHLLQEAWTWCFVTSDMHFYAAP